MVVTVLVMESCCSCFCNLLDLCTFGHKLVATTDKPNMSNNKLTTKRLKGMLAALEQTVNTVYGQTDRQKRKGKMLSEIGKGIKNRRDYKSILSFASICLNVYSFTLFALHSVFSILSPSTFFHFCMCSLFQFSIFL